MYAQYKDGPVPFYIFQANDTTFLINPVFRGPPADGSFVFSAIEPVVVLTDPEAVFVYLKTYTVLSSCIKSRFGLRTLVTLPLVHYILSYWDCYNLKRLFFSVPFEPLATDVSLTINGVSVRFASPLEVHFTVNDSVCKCAVSCRLADRMRNRQTYYIQRVSELYALVDHVVSILRETESGGRDINNAFNLGIDARIWPSFIFLVRLLDFAPFFDDQNTKHFADSGSVKGSGNSFRLQALIGSGKITTLNSRAASTRERTIVYFKESTAADANTGGDAGAGAIASIDGTPINITIATSWSGGKRVELDQLVWTGRPTIVPLTYPSFSDLLQNRPDAAFGPCTRLEKNCELVELSSMTAPKAEESFSERFEL